MACEWPHSLEWRRVRVLTQPSRSMLLTTPVSLTLSYPRFARYLVGLGIPYLSSLPRPELHLMISHFHESGVGDSYSLDCSELLQGPSPDIFRTTFRII